MARVSAEVAGRLLRRHIPDQVLDPSLTPQGAALVAQIILNLTGIGLSTNQVYNGVGWLMDNPNGSPPLTMVPGEGYAYTRDAQRVFAAIAQRRTYANTYLRRLQTGLVVPFAEQVERAADPVAADARIDRMQDALIAVSNI